MQRLVVGSLNPCAGKTSFIMGLASERRNRLAYLKPLGDRLLYRKKRQWDHDVLLLENHGEVIYIHPDCTLGFDPSKLRYMYPGEQLEARLGEILNELSAEVDLTVIETGCDPQYGAGLGLDPIRLARSMEAKLLMLASGHHQDMADRMLFWSRYIRDVPVSFVLNKVEDGEGFRTEYGDELAEAGVDLVGILPKVHELDHYPVRYLCDQLFASVITGEDALQRPVSHVLLLASDQELTRAGAEFRKEGTVVVTGGDRADVVMSAITKGVAAIVLTGENEIGANLIAQAERSHIPILLVRHSTSHTIKTIGRIDPLFDTSDKKHQEVMGSLIRNHMDMSKIL